MAILPILTVAVGLLAADEMGKFAVGFRCEKEKPVLLFEFADSSVHDGEHLSLDVSPKSGGPNLLVSFTSTVESGSMRLGFDRDPNTFFQVIRWSYFDPKGIDVRVYTGEAVILTASIWTHGSFGDELMRSAKACLSNN